MIFVSFILFWKTITASSCSDFVTELDDDDDDYDDDDDDDDDDDLFLWYG